MCGTTGLTSCDTSWPGCLKTGGCISAAQCDGDIWVGRGSWLVETHGAAPHSGYSVSTGVQCVQLELK